MIKLAIGSILAACAAVAPAQLQSVDVEHISPSSPVEVGKAPAMKFQIVRQSADESVYAITFAEGDEALSGLTDFAIAHKVQDAHFTAIGAVSSATLAWLDLPRKAYRPIPVTEQCEVLALTGDVAAFNGKPVVHMHAVLARHDGSTVGGHVFALHVEPTLEVFMTVDAALLAKKADDASGIKVIDPRR